MHHVNVASHNRRLITSSTAVHYIDHHPKEEEEEEEEENSCFEYFFACTTNPTHTPNDNECIALVQRAPKTIRGANEC